MFQWDMAQSQCDSAWLQDFSGRQGDESEQQEEIWRGCPSWEWKVVLFWTCCATLECVHITFQGKLSKHSLDSSISRHRENLLDMQLNTQLCCHKDQYTTSLPPHLGFHSLTHVFKYFWLTWHSHFPTIGINRELLLFLNTFAPNIVQKLTLRVFIHLKWYWKMSLLWVQY